MAVSNECVRIWSVNVVLYGLFLCVCIITTSTDLLVFISLLRSQMLFQGYKDVFITVYILILSTLTGLPYSFILESLKTAAQLVVRTP